MSAGSIDAAIKTRMRAKAFIRDENRRGMFLRKKEEPYKSPLCPASELDY